MKVLSIGVAAIVLVAGATVTPALAQGVRFGAAGGPVFILEENGGTDFDILGTVAVGGSAERAISFRVDGMWHFADGGDIISGTGNAVYNFLVSEETKFRPYLIGGGGLYYFNPEGDFDGTTDFGINAGAGFKYPLGAGKAKLFVEGRFHFIFSDPENLNLLPINVGVMFGGS